jgi:hypothetical protein
MKTEARRRKHHGEIFLLRLNHLDAVLALSIHGEELSMMG